MGRLAAVVLLLLVFLPATAAREQSPAAPRPNVVLVITDDLGWGDLGSYGAVDIRTPSIDSLARDGARLTDFYANGVLCTPTRAALISGRYPQRFGLEIPLTAAGTPGSEHGLRATGRSLPQLLRQHGYATALAGKWHLGYTPETSPGAHGFALFFGLKSGYHDYYAHTDSRGQPDLWENDRVVDVPGYTTDLVTKRAIDFIEQQRARPFFIDVAYNAPHWPYQRPDAESIAAGNARHLMPGEAEQSTRADYVAMVEGVDRGVGQLLGAIERLGLAGSTIVIFTNDNGGEWLSSNGPLFHRKLTVWEGGIRVPMLVRWPGRVPPGKVSDQVAITMDLTASILAATGVVLPPDARLDGTNLFPILEGREPERERTLFWRTSFVGFLQKAVRSGDWKLVIDGAHTLLFNLRSDIGEREDLAARRQDVVSRLRPLLAAWEKDVDAEAKSWLAKPEN